ncbi:hypothetical protein CS345_14820 [Bordetella bronchiseptica]|nr:hypothetical protein B7P04_17160 [Bordetella bronchiseptica]AWP85739.1 hypothetical protein B7P00_17115 [Bordetella bronchiseptica]AWQ11315.1 hypothetical protein B9G72_17130 [Bordetella bronchiseptica]AXT88336.1 hypothetical protein CJ015_07225 [Bordetella bronchiseptica]AZW13626.1 hypothetical protein CS344_16965 [Bordetella bronchiseptica]
MPMAGAVRPSETKPRADGRGFCFAGSGLSRITAPGHRLARRAPARDIKARGAFSPASSLDLVDENRTRPARSVGG